MLLFFFLSLFEDPAHEPLGEFFKQVRCLFFTNPIPLEKILTVEDPLSDELLREGDAFIAEELLLKNLRTDLPLSDLRHLFEDYSDVLVGKNEAFFLFFHGYPKEFIGCFDDVSDCLPIEKVGFRNPNVLHNKPPSIYTSATPPS